ncbi:unnamed protein product [Sphagnum jensenii]|uniref:Peroxidase n=1 Tax=Sphagnum jensenii TaxID=128206 RepID=A0ABP0VYR6_9BRYO
MLPQLMGGCMCYSVESTTDWVAETGAGVELHVVGKKVLPPITYGVGFYSSSCPNAEKIIAAAVIQKWTADKTITAGLLRMFFHDCFIRGCDASILIQSTPRNQAELDAGPNLTIHGLDLIDTAKAALEKACPGVVSCADIIALATRDAVVMSGGPFIAFPTGRRDGRVSRILDVNNLPGPQDTVSDALAAFSSIGLNINDLVSLLGAHTVGVAHCVFFNDRLYDFQATGLPDPTMDVALLASLRKVCPPNLDSFGNAVPLDQGTDFVVDASYFTQIRMNHGILQIDQELTHDARTVKLIRNIARNFTPFGPSFARSMLKLGNVGVLTGKKGGEIRRICSKIN